MTANSCASAAQTARTPRGGGIGRMTGATPGRMAGMWRRPLGSHLVRLKVIRMPLDATGAPPPDELDPYSAQVVHAFERVGPAVVHVIAFGADGRPKGRGPA